MFWLDKHMVLIHKVHGELDNLMILQSNNKLHLLIFNKLIQVIVDLCNLNGMEDMNIW